MSMLYLLLKLFRLDLGLCAHYDGPVIRKGHAHLALRQRHIGRRPAENPFRILRCDVDTTMRALFAKSIMPERAMDRDPITADHGIPWHGRRGIPGLERACRHVERDDLPMSQQIADRCGEFIAC